MDLFKIYIIKGKAMFYFSTKKNKKLLISILSIFLLVGCSGNKPIQKNNDKSFTFDEYHNIPYLKYEEIFEDKNNKQAIEGKYANSTTDGALNWAEIKGDFYELTPIADDMFKKITLDGRKITLPMSFGELGKEFRDFKNMDISDFTDDNAPISITNSEGNTLYIKKFDPYPKILKWNVFMSLFDKKNQLLIALELSMQDKMIWGLSNNMFLSVKELRVDDIGVGNTFNEMYAKFGKPYVINASEDGQSILVGYSNVDSKGNNHSVFFRHRAKINNPKTKKKEDTKPNVITDVSVSIIRDFIEKKK
jgi:hypothetical protein